MSASKFVVVKEWPIGKEPEKVLEFILACKPGETRDELASRYLTTIKYPPPPAIDRPVAPVIPPLLPPDAPRPKYSQAIVDDAAKLEPSVVFETRWLNIPAGEALPFEPDDLVMAAGSVAGIPVTSPFRENSTRLEQFQSVCINPVVAPRFRVPTKRKHIVLTLPGASLVSQFGKGQYLGQILSLELAVFVPSKMTTEFWFQSGTAARNKKFVRAACELGYDGQFSESYMAAMPSASSPFPPPAASIQLLKSVGIEPRDDRKNLVLYKRKKYSQKNLA